MDRPKPGESLYANIVWCLSDFEYKISLSSNQLTRFSNNQEFDEINLVTGKPGAFLINMKPCIKPNNEISWNIISDVHRSQVDISDLQHKIQHDNKLPYKISEGIKTDACDLEKYIGNAD